jgi:malate dehydrogenase
MISKTLSRLFSSNSRNSSRKVAVLGAAGGIGQPLSLLLKTSSSPSIAHLALYDIANMGMAADLGHISTATKVSGHSGDSQLADALNGAEIVLIPAGVPRKPGMTRDDLFSTNATIVRNLAAACAQHCPSAHILVISNPVNSTVPIAVETMKAAGVAKPSVFGVTTLDLVRAKTFIGQIWNVDPQQVNIPVIGGHSGPTIVPLLSQIKVKGDKTPRATFTSEQVDELVKRIQYGGDEVVQAKAGSGSATLSMAYAAQVFFDDLCRALDTKSSVPQIAFVKGESGSPSLPTEYFATQIELGAKGLEKILPAPQAKNEKEKELLAAALEGLQKDITKGLDFAKNFELKQQTK